MTSFESEGAGLHASVRRVVADGSRQRAHRAAVEVDRAEDGVSCRLGDASCASAHAGRAVQRASAGRGGTIEQSLLRLQRDYGNRFVGRVLREVASREATPDAGGEVSDTVERRIEGARGAGQGLDSLTRTRMERGIGADFGNVRVHTDDRADELSRSLAARAFTTGTDVFFRHGEYSPGTSSGRELLAHELTHVAQQTGGLHPKMTVSDPNDPHELEADRVARAVVAHEGASEEDERRHDHGTTP